MRSERPHVAERIDERARAVAVELVGHRPLLFRTRRERLRENPVDVGHVDHEADRRAAARLRTVVGIGLVGEHHGRIADLHFGVRDLAVGAREAEQFLRVERLLVERDRFRGAVDDEVGRDGVVTGGNRCNGHCSLLLVGGGENNA